VLGFHELCETQVTQLAVSHREEYQSTARKQPPASMVFVSPADAS
jgi:hypothetical protein